MKLNKLTHRKSGLKIFSLFLATIIWFYIHAVVQKISGGPLAYKDLKNVQIRLMGEPLVLGKNVFAVELERQTVDLRVKGPEQEIERVAPLDIAAYVDISGLKPGRTYSPVINFVLPPNIEVVGALPLVRVEIKDKTL